MKNKILIIGLLFLGFETIAQSEIQRCNFEKAKKEKKISFRGIVNHIRNHGYFQLTVPQGGQYKIRIEHPDYLPAAFDASEETYKEYTISKLVVGDNIPLNNVHFVQSKAELLPESFEQLDILVNHK
jgi:hypothetical protein